MKAVGYRAESFSGSGVRKLREVLYFEVFELNNTGTLHDLRKMLEPGELRDQLSEIIDGLETPGLLYREEGLDMGEYDCLCFLQDVIDEVNRKLKKNYRYGLWLADRDAVKDYYGASKNEIDCYEKSDFKIDDLGYEGALYLYEDEPVKYLIT